MDFFTVCIAITSMISIACIAYLNDELNKINTRLSNMSYIVDRVIDINDKVMNNNRKMIEYMETLENHINKEESNSVLRENDI